jgi:murein DD-endopeptidase MepM/ murein hydrolase activator NlpD
VDLPRDGSYAFPVTRDYGYIDDYGAPRAVTGWHHGNDIFAPTGTPVVAVASGILSKVGVNTLGGNRLWLTDDRGNQFYYAHLSAYAPSTINGARVRAGEVIGFVGNSGQAITTPPHLHFEIHPGGLDSVNPYPYLLAWERGSNVALAFEAATVARGQAPASGALLVEITPDRDEVPTDDSGIARAVG